MPNATMHRLGAAVAAGLAVAHHEVKNGESSAKPLLAGGLGAVFGTLPDILEPALHPNHRQFFHSLAFAGLVGLVWHKLYKWQPNSVEDKYLRAVLLIAGGACLTHLAMDAFTAKGLPLVGRI